MALSPDTLRLISYAPVEADLHQSGEMDFHEAAMANGNLSRYAKRICKILEDNYFVRSKLLIEESEAQLDLADHIRADQLNQRKGAPEAVAHSPAPQSGPAL